MNQKIPRIKRGIFWIATSDQLLFFTNRVNS